MKLIVKKVAEGIFDFCESSNGILYDGMIYGGTEVNLSYANDALKVAVTTGEVGVYDLTDLNYDDGNEIIGFASMNEFIIALKDAGFTGNFNTPQAGGVKEAYIALNQNGTDIITEQDSYGCSLDISLRDDIGIYTITINFDTLNTDLPIYVISSKSNVVVGTQLAGNELALSSYIYATNTLSDGIMTPVIITFKQFV